LRLALEGLTAAADDPRSAGAWLTLAMRERNRVWDALLGTVAALSTGGDARTHSNAHSQEGAQPADAPAIR
jgi:hypothetical protein